MAEAVLACGFIAKILQVRFEDLPSDLLLASQNKTGPVGVHWGKEGGGSRCEKQRIRGIMLS